jgi:hypothetical protein
LARLDPWLVPSHPDRVGGLGILEMGQKSFGTFVLGISTILAANLGDDIVSGAVTLRGSIPTIAVYCLICLVVVTGPLFAFVPNLLRAKRRGLVEYGDLGDELFRAFDEKWTPLQGTEQQALLGGADPSSLADYGYAYEVVGAMRIVPISRNGVLFVLTMALLPFLPLLLIKYSIMEIIQQLTGILG